MNQRILIDYFVASWKIQSYDEQQQLRFFRELDRSPGDFQLIKSYYGLKCCYYYEGVKIHVGDDLVILDCSGKGCRTMEEKFGWDWAAKFNEWQPEIMQHPHGEPPAMHVARLDVACDLLDDYVITVPKLQDLVRKGKFTCLSQYHICTDGNEEGIYFGSPRSDRRVRIYNKAKEQGIETPWVRFEFQLRNDNATSFLLNYFQEKHIGKTFYGMMHNYLNFTQPSVMDIMMKDVI